MFYGYYDGTFPFKLNETEYDFPLAYFFVMLCIFIFNLIVVVVSSANSFHASLTSEEDDSFSGLAFATYDFSIYKKSSIQKGDIARRLKLAANVMQRREEEEERTSWSRFKV